jgi:Pectate lyase superfamily protein
MTVPPDVYFTAHPFTASGAATPRTMPDRLNDIFNVKDFGALGDGHTDDTDAINAAIDRAYSGGVVHPRNGAIILFPPGIYIIGKGNPGTVNLQLDRNPGGKSGKTSIIYRGCGRDASVLRGNFWNGNPINTPPQSGTPGFLLICNFFDAQVSRIENLGIENTNTSSGSGALLVQLGPVQLINCRIKGVIGYVNQVLGFGGRVANCVFECSRPITAASAATRSPNFSFSNFGYDVLQGSLGCAVAQGYYHGNTAKGFDIGFAFSGPPGCLSSTIGNKAIQCGIGFGGFIAGDTESDATIPPPGNPPCPPSWGGHSFTAWSSNWAERCMWGIYPGFSGSMVAANAVTGDTGPNIPAVIGNITWSNGTAIVTTRDPHNIPASAISGISIQNITAGDNNVVRIWVANDYSGILSNGDRVRIQGVTGTIDSYINAGDDGTGLWSIGAYNFVGGYRWFELHNSTFSGSWSGGGTFDLTTQIVIDALPAGLTPDGTGHQIVACTRTGANTFTYRLASFPGFTSATWNYPIEYCMVSGLADRMVLLANHFDALVSRQALELARNPVASQVGGRNLIAAMAPRGGWAFTGELSRTAGGYTFINCGTPGNTPPVAIPIAALPPQAPQSWAPNGTVWRPVEGDERNVNDAQNASFRGTVSAGAPNNHYKVRYDGTNWRRIG